MPVESVSRNLIIRTRHGQSYFVARFQKDGKRVERSIGRIDQMGIREAKKRCADIIADSENIIIQSKTSKSKAPTFEEVLPEALRSIAEVKVWKDHRAYRQWEQSLYDHAVPVIGHIPVDKITTEDVFQVLKPIWRVKTETASRVRMRVEAVLAWCILKNYIKDGKNVAVWRNNLSLLLPPKTKVSCVTHHEAPTLPEVKKIVEYCLKRPGCVNACLLFIIATLGRVQECVKADKAEIKEGIWTVPDERMKTKQDVPYRVPLSSLAKEAIKMCPKKGILFGKNNTPISTNTPRLKLRMITGRSVTAHGIRSTFRDWCARNGVEDSVAEKCLSHRFGDQTVRAYFRDDLIEKRRDVLEMWAKEVMPITFGE